MVNIKQLVAEELASSTPMVKSAVISHLVTEEQQKRVNAVLTVIHKLEDSRKEGFKLKPDLVSYDSEGNVITSNYSKPAYEALKKNREQTEKFEAAINEALDPDKFNFDKVFKIAGGQPDEKAK